jgi:phage FluMu gp28-like protein
MSAMLPFTRIDSDTLLTRYFTKYQIIWIHAEDPFHAAKKRVFALAEKSVRIGWTFADGFKNVRKRLRFPNRDYLFATRDWPSALEYMNQVYTFADMLGYTRAVLSHGEDMVKVKAAGADGAPGSLTEEVKIGYIKFDNGSRIIAFSSNPYAMAVYGGDVGLDEFAKHPNAKLLWETAQGRVTLGHDLAVWSAHDGEDTLFNQFVQQARAANPVEFAVPSERGTAGFLRHGKDDVPVVPNIAVSPISDLNTEYGTPNTHPPITPSLQSSTTPCSPWNLYFRVTLQDALELGLLNIVQRTRDVHFTPETFLADCRTRAGAEEIFQQSYMCNPVGAASAAIVEWSAIERCRYDYEIKRVHLENDDLKKQFGEFNPQSEQSRSDNITDFIDAQFKPLFQCKSVRDPNQEVKKYRLGFDVAASGQGDLCAMYIDEEIGNDLWLAGLFTARTEDWHFLKTVLHHFLWKLKNVRGAGDESGLGRQICWEAASQWSYKFKKVNFTTKKHDLGFALMNQLSVAEKRFPRSHQDIASDFFALRKIHTGTRWNFSEGKNLLNPASHCDIAWAGALSTFAHMEGKTSGVGAAILMDSGAVFHSKDMPTDAAYARDPEKAEADRIRWMLNSDDPAIWTRWR